MPNILENLGSPKYVLAPMVDASELAWRMLGRRYGVQLSFTPMINSNSFISDKKYRLRCLQFCNEDRPLIAQFCANSPDTFINASKFIQDHCDAIDLNLGCPQGIAKRGHYGAFLQDEWELLKTMVSRAASELRVPVTCKIRIFPDVQRTVEYAKMLESSGASMLTVHGRTRDMKGANTGLADWNQIKAVKEAVEIPVIANGNIQYLNDVHQCLAFTKADAVMSAEGHLHNPAIFSGLQPSVFSICFEYFDLATEFPTPIQIVRGHVFKLCVHTLEEHPEFRHPVASACTIEEMRSVMEQLQKLCSESCSKNIATSLPHPHWLCQPYIRPKVYSHDKGNLNEAQESTNRPDSDQENKDTDISIRKLLLREQRRIRKVMKKEAKIAKRINRIKHSQLCSICEENIKGHTCIQSACRTCCQTLNSNECKVHSCK